MTILQWIQAEPFKTTARTILGTFTNQQSLRIYPSLHPVVNVLSKINLIESCITIFTSTFRYRCTYLHKTEILYWNTSVSDHCCLTCTNTTYKADTVIETIELDDKCKSIETQVCRKLPGSVIFLSSPGPSPSPSPNRPPSQIKVPKKKEKRRIWTLG